MMWDIGVGHTRKCQRTICNSARMKRKLTLDLKKLREGSVNRWMRCANCCHVFVDMSLENFYAFLCRQHEDEAKHMLRIESLYRRQITRINRHSRHLYIKHKRMWKLNIGKTFLDDCPEDSFSIVYSELRQLHYASNLPKSVNSSSTTSTIIGQRRMFAPHSFGPPTSVCSFCGALLWYEERVKKGSTIANPRFSICCRKGKVQLPGYQKAPDYLLHLLDYNGGSDSKTFRHNIRGYNSVFAFTSMGGHVDNNINDGRGPYVFRINGQNHHRIGSLLPLEGKPKFARLYFYDTRNEITNRATAHGGNTTNSLDYQIVGNLISMFDQCNELTKVFRVARDRFHATEYRPITVHLLERRYRDGRQYNLPTCSRLQH